MERGRGDEEGKLVVEKSTHTQTLTSQSTQGMGILETILKLEK